jgi:putative glutamine amidotransferase
MRPRILVSTDTRSDKFRNYVRAIESAGGEVVRVGEGDNPTDAAAKADDADGWLIVGGRDLPPLDEPVHPKSELITASRLAIEHAVFDSVMPTDKPVLGVCMGAQYLNWKAGGPLEQHIPDIGICGHGALTGSDEDTTVRIAPGSLLANCLGSTTVKAKCHHHQAIRTVADGYVAVAWEDGVESVVEAIEDATGRWTIGVQWHPERTPEAESDSLFRAFVNACASRP